MAPPTVAQKMLSIFDSCQKGHGNHEQGVRKLHELLVTCHGSNTTEEFRQTFKNLAAHTTVHFKREPSVERCVEFLVKFLTYTMIAEDCPEMGCKEEEIFPCGIPPLTSDVKKTKSAQFGEGSGVVCADTRIDGGRR